ncbi:MAG TPA: beta-ketoacyl-ACP synthase II [Ktedonobacterales bacterium]|nr:beta-ketoacyl-ACP synthase II [Ktedonobacterales bacterium]
MTTRVAVTGIGMVTPLGNDTATSWEALKKGVSGIGPITKFDASAHESRIAGEVKGFDPLLYMDRKEARRNDIFAQYALAATVQALNDSKLDVAPVAEDTGIIIGSGIGGLTTMHEQFKLLFDRGPDRISPFFSTMTPIDLAAGFISITLGLGGPNFAVVSACATGANAIGEAYETIRRGDARVMVAGGAEAAVQPVAIASFGNMHAMSRRNDDPAHASRPFDAERDGFVMGEGAGILILEDMELAQERGARIYAELVGYGATADAHHITEPAPEGRGLVRAMRRALQKGGIAPEEVNYINAHGTSTPPNDRSETGGIKALFGAHAYKLAVSSTKSMTGHMMGAAGGVEAAISALSIYESIMPPTINYVHPDPECDLDYVPNQARKADVRVALSNSMGFGGHNATLVFRRYEA